MATSAHTCGGTYSSACEACSEMRAIGLGKARRRVAPAIFACLECGRKFRSAAAAEKAAFGDDGCPGCGGSDIDAYYGG